MRPLAFVAMADFRESSIKGSNLQHSVGVTKLSVERGVLVFIASVKLGMDYCPLYGVAGVSNVLKSMKK